MQRHPATATARRTDLFPPELERLRSTATVVMNEHLNDAGLCAICGSAWPCGRVRLAEHNLALL